MLAAYPISHLLGPFVNLGHYLCLVGMESRMTYTARQFRSTMDGDSPTRVGISATIRLLHDDYNGSNASATSCSIDRNLWSVI